MPMRCIDIESKDTADKISFMIQTMLENVDGIRGCSMDCVATYFSHMHNIKFSKHFWETTIWPILQAEV